VERLDLRIGEERAVHLPPPPDWAVRVEGMSSVVQVRKLWAANPYPEDDDDDEAARPPPDTVFMVRGVAPGTVALHFSVSGAGRGEDRDVRVTVRM
jgi:hypothetical protein